MPTVRPPSTTATPKQGFFSRIKSEASAQAANGREVFSAPEANVDRLEELGPGDKLVLGGELALKFGNKVEVAAEVTMKRASNGAFVAGVEFQGLLEVGVAEAAAAQGTLAVGAEFEFPNSDEANAALAQLRGLGTRGLDAFRDRLTKVFLAPSVGGALEAKLGWSPLGLKAKGELAAGLQWALEFDGDQTRLVREERVTAEVKAEAKPRNTFAAGEAHVGATAFSGKLNAEVTLRSTLALPAEVGVRDVARAMLFVGDITGLGDGALGATREVEISLERASKIAGADAGTTWTVTASDVSAKDAAVAALAAVQGEGQRALAALGDGAEVSAQTYRDRGLDVEVNAGLGSLGFEVRVQNEIRDVEPVASDSVPSVGE